MFVTNLCAFPPLFEDQPISLGTAGTSISTEFEAPVDTTYIFELKFEFASTAKRVEDNLVGSWPPDYCMVNVRYEKMLEAIPPKQRVRMGHSIPIRIVVRNA
ncbi:MAG: hypothetical protein R3E83_15620, partial [Burkholderiaceae bacterium]